MNNKNNKEKMLCEHCQSQLDKLVALGLFTNKDIEILRRPRRVLTVNFPLTKDSGEKINVEGFRVQYNDALGPTKGGLRIHQDADLEEVTELAYLMSLKTSLVGLPYGGAKGAIRINPRELSKSELERVERGFIQNIAHFIGEKHDIPAPDVNTNAETMKVMLDEYEKVVGHKSPATFTGKPFALGGSLGRETSTSKGGFYIIQEMLKGTEPGEVTVAIQGFGNVGSNLAQMLYEVGYKIVAVSDSKTGIYEEGGLDIPKLIEFKKSGGSFSDRPEEKIANEKLLELDVSLLIPSALGGVITKKNAQKIKAGTIIEMANGPVTPEADAVLNQSRVRIIPDILANSGGVIVSYFEWLQNLEEEQWTSKKVDEKLKKMIISAYKDVAEESSRRPKIDMRSVCHLLAVKRILEAEK